MLTESPFEGNAKGPAKGVIRLVLLCYSKERNFYIGWVKLQRILPCLDHMLSDFTSQCNCIGRIMLGQPPQYC
jgi:hypothetical protein